MGIGGISDLQGVGAGIISLGLGILTFLGVFYIWGYRRLRQRTSGTYKVLVSVGPTYIFVSSSIGGANGGVNYSKRGSI